MDEFYKQLDKYIRKMEKKYPVELAPPFKYDEDTIISASVANEIYGIYSQVSVLQQLWNKEKDYCRLLKKENDELKDELDYLYDSDDDEDDVELNNNEKEYLS